MVDGKSPEQSDSSPKEGGQYGTQQGVVGGKDLIAQLKAIEDAHPDSARVPGTAQAAIEALNTAVPRRRPSLLDFFRRKK